MAEDILSCAICLDLLKNPVSIPCGHSYCLDCISSCWDQSDVSESYNCPQCRKVFTVRPALNKNTMLAELAEGLRRTRSQADPDAVSAAGPGDVSCDICTGRKNKAFKSCLVCLASYCETHIQSHFEAQALQKHHLIDASVDLQQRICSRHDKPLEIFCRTDENFICYLCVMNEHSGHMTVSTAAERTEKQKQLVESQKKYQNGVEEREIKIKELKQKMQNLKLSAQSAEEESEMLFTKLIQSIENSRSTVKKLLSAQKKAGLNLGEELVEKLEQDIADLRRRSSELEQLSHTEDHMHFLQSFQSYSGPPESPEIPHLTMNYGLFIKELRKVVSGVEREVTQLHDLDLFTFREGQSAFLSDPKTRDEFLKYSCQLTLDPNTAHRQLCLSENNRRVTVTHEAQNYPAHPERFDLVQHVLSKESLPRRCYWEVLETNNCHYSVALSYKEIDRKGKENNSKFGYNNQSWSLTCNYTSYSFRHNNKVVPVPVDSTIPKIGVYLDQWAGTLSFYSVSDTPTLLYKVQTTFSQPLYAGFEIYGYGQYIEICDQK